MKIPRKLKKRIIKCFGRGTYRGIIGGYLNIERYHKNNGSETVYTEKALSGKFDVPWFYAYQCTPHLTFLKIKTT